MKGIKKFVKDESGAVMVMFTVVLVIILSTTALVVDAGMFYYQKSRQQTALDSAALAAAKSLPNYFNAQQVAFEYLEKNGIDSLGAVVEFPTPDTVRVRKTLKTNTMFGKIMDVDALYANQRATAKYSEIKAALNLPYLLYAGDPNATIQLKGQFAINGNIHVNGAIYISGGSLPSGVVSPYGDYKSYISGIVSCGSGDESDFYVANVWNVGKFYYNWWSNNVEEVRIGQQQISMPDYDSLIMALAPVYDQSVFNITSSFPVWSMTNGATNFFYKMLYDSYGSPTFPNNPSTLSYDVPYSVTISGNFSGRNHPTVFQGSVYFDSSVSFNRANTIYGDCYVNGNLEQTGGNTYLDVKGNLYVKGDIDLAGHANVDGDIICTGDFEKGGGTTLTCGGDIYSGGNMNIRGGLTVTKGVVYAKGTFVTSAGSPVSVNGIIIADGNMNFGGMPVHLTTDSTTTLSVYSRHGNVTFNGSAAGTTVYGMIYAPEGHVKFGSGNLKFYGSVIANTFECGSGGVSFGECTRELPFMASKKLSLLIE